MKILIAGGSGFIGSHLCKSYLDRGHEVTVIDNLSTGRRENLSDLEKNPNLKFIKGDLVNFDFSGMEKFDLVFDLSSPASPVDFRKLSLEILKVNSIGLLNLLDFFVKSQSKTFVFASTSEIYGDPLTNPQRESYLGNVNSYGPRACYDEGKRFGEAAIYSYRDRYGVDLRVARIFNTYGPKMRKDDGRVVSNFIVQALENKPFTVFGDGKQTRSLCYVDDMVDGLDKLGTTPGLSKTVVNLGNPDERTVLDIAAIVKDLTGTKSEIAFKPIGEDDPKVRCPDITLAKKILGWQPKTDLETGIKLTIKYFQTL